MSFIQKILADFRVASEDPAVMRSQMTALAKQLPLLYMILGANAVALSFTHYGLAPDLLTLYFPGVLLTFCIIRIATWFRTDVALLSDAAVQRRLRSTIILVGIFGVIFTAWSIALFPYGSACEQIHVEFFMSITVIGCIFCLMHLRPAALVLTGVVVMPFMLRFMTTGNVVLSAIALNFFLVAIIMIIILLTYYKDFRDLVHSQRHLAALSTENLRIANVDSLTGLANRRSFFGDLQSMIEDNTAGGPAFTLGLIDLDGFKPINDVYGHSAGDQVLIEVGRRLSRTLGGGARCARLGGDEFGLVLPHVTDLAAIKATGDAICAAIQQPLGLAGGTAQVAASIGFAAFPQMAASQEQLIERADYALYHAKEHHRGTPVMFTKDHEKAIRARSLIEQELRQADLDAELSLQFQPIVDVQADRVVAFEALARWHSPVLGRVPPLDFIAAAERMGMINRLTEVLFRKACAVLQHWPEQVYLSFNLSVHDIASSTAVRRLIGIMAESGVVAERIAFEITETAVMRDFDQAREALLDLKQTGADIALDDFGTGFSSLSYVHRLPLDKIKVDRSFMAGLTNDRASRDIVKSIVDLCRNLKIACVVEGVETAEQVIVLRSLGCTTIQGYYFSKPMDGSAIAGYLERRLERAAPAPWPAAVTLRSTGAEVLTSGR
jgi:diguanylate cyclase (GGDEF)-like protein